MNVIEQIFLILNRSNLNYCVVSNPNGLPEHCESDIDLIYSGASEKDICSLVRSIEEEAGCICLQKVITGYEEYSFMLAQEGKNKRITKIQLDFFQHLYHKNFGIIMTGDRILAMRKIKKCFYVPADIDELYYTVLRRSAKGHFDTSHCQLVKMLNDQIGEQVRIDEKKKFPAIWNVIEKVVQGGKLEPAVLDACVRASSNKITLINRIKIVGYRILKYYPRRFLQPLGVSIAFLAPDGAGKTTIIDSINQDPFYKDFFYSIDNKYFRPKLLKNPGHYNALNPKEESMTNSNPHNVVLNNPVKSFARFMFYNIDFIFGSLLRIYPQKIRRNLIIFDRYYYDYFADMKRYQYNLPECIPALFSWSIPKPDIVFILEAPADVLYQRKQELTIEEINEVNSQFRKNSKYFGNSYFINVNRSVEDITREIRMIVIKYLTERENRRRT